MPHQRDDSYRAQWADFLTAISDNKEPLVGGRAGLAVLKIVESAKASAQNKSVQQRISVSNAAYV
jgi:predicted dehydrogenase